VNVVVVSGICVRDDAISNAVADQLRLLASLEEVCDVRLVTQAIDRPLDAPVHVVHGPWSLLTLPEVRDADLVIFHWGIAYELFDAIVAAPTERRRVAVHFHNVTPLDLLTGPDREKGAWSLAQASVLSDLDVELWTYSEHNCRTLTDLGVPSDRIHDVPIVIEPPQPVHRRARGPISELLTVGRLTPAKGVHVLIEALSLLPPSQLDGLHATLAGNVTLSDAAYVAQLRRLITDSDLAAHVELLDAPSKAELWDRYASADVVVSPSFHEGLCVPIVEGYLAGCRAIGTDRGNLPFVVQPPDPIVPAGDPHALAAAITTITSDEERARSLDPSRVRDLTAGFSTQAVVTALRRRVAANA
jgi:glycosyltransferase involved in cell wall biosynthesis